MNVTIIGAGNIGTQFAVYSAAAGHDVIIYTNNYKKISKKLSIVDKNGIVQMSSKIICATKDLKTAFKNVDLVFVTVPAFMMKKIARDIIDYLPVSAKIALIPGTGGGEYAFKDFINKGGVLFGLQRVPSVARLVEYGKSVCTSGYRSELFVSALPDEYSSECAKLMQDIFGIKCSTLPNYLNITLTPSNPILHTTRLYSLFKNYKEGMVYNSIPLFYEEWDDASSEILLACDDELQEICKALKGIDLSCVKSLKLHYESNNVEQMTAKIRSINSLKGINTPSIKVNGGFIPDFNSRYFTADFPYGIAIIKQIGDMANINTSNITKVWNWYKNLNKCESYFKFEDYKINNTQELLKFYKGNGYLQ